MAQAAIQRSRLDRPNVTHTTLAQLLRLLKKEMRRCREAPSCHAAPRMNSPSLGYVCSFSEVISHRLSCEKHCPQNTLLKLRKMAVHTSSTCKKTLPDVASNVNLNDHLHVRNPTFVMENHEITIMCGGSQMVFMFPYTCLRPRSVQENSNLRQSFFPLTQCLKEQLPTPQKILLLAFPEGNIDCFLYCSSGDRNGSNEPLGSPLLHLLLRVFPNKSSGTRARNRNGSEVHVLSFSSLRDQLLFTA